MTNAEWQKCYCQRLKEKYLTEELRKKEPERCKGNRIANIEEIRKTGKGNKSTTDPKKHEKLQLHPHTKV